MTENPDIIVIGGGHAGVEAAAAPARMGLRVLLITNDPAKIGEMSCNPAIGGLGKGHLVREIDALDGLMGRVADRSGIQFRLLNRSKGPAVRGPRAQADRALYRANMQAEVATQRGLTVLAGAVTDLLSEGGRCRGVVLETGERIEAGAVVLTAGTFLRGVIHRGTERIEAGRIGEAPAASLGRALERLDLPLGRLKTGTPPRLDGRTIDWASLEKQPADAEPVPFSFLTDRIDVPQVECGITHTNARTHEIISRNLHASAVYGGAIRGNGPRYCPSIEDKVVRFAEKEAHQVFLEPEGLKDTTVYPNGISTSLPAEVQLDLVRSMRGLTEAEIVQPGYAIEYDYVDPRALGRSLEVRSMPGLFLAGQVNGTTGYEEAAGQGLLAGVNAARAVRGEASFVVGREQGYLGVMVDDLVTRGVTEPYRMFTSRAEYRLTLRADNADERLTPLGIGIGCVGSERRDAFHVKHRVTTKAVAWARDTTLTPKEASEHGLAVNQDGRRRSVSELLALPGQDTEALSTVWPKLREMPRSVRDRLEADALYAGYLDRQAQEIADVSSNDALEVPAGFDYSRVQGLSNEVRTRLARVRPETLGQAGRMEGMTPSALATLLVAIRRDRSSGAEAAGTEAAG